MRRCRLPEEIAHQSACVVYHGHDLLVGHAGGTHDAYNPSHFAVMVARGHNSERVEPGIGILAADAHGKAGAFTRSQGITQQVTALSQLEQGAHLLVRAEFGLLGQELSATEEHRLVIAVRQIKKLIRLLDENVEKLSLPTLAPAVSEPLTQRGPDFAQGKTRQPLVQHRSD